MIQEVIQAHRVESRQCGWTRSLERESGEWTESTEDPPPNPVPWDHSTEVHSSHKHSGERSLQAGFNHSLPTSTEGEGQRSHLKLPHICNVSEY